MLPVVRGSGDRAPDRALCDRDGRLHDRRRILARPALHGRGRRAGHGIRRARGPPASRPHTRASAALFHYSLPRTSPCSSRPLLSIRCSCERQRPRTAEPPLRLGALRALLAALRRHRDRRGHISNWTSWCAGQATLSAGVFLALQSSAAGSAARGEGPRHRGPHHDVRLGALCRPRFGTDRARVVALESAGWGRGGDEPPRVRLRNHLGEPALRRRAEPARFGTASRGRVERRKRGGPCARRSRPRPRDRYRRVDPSRPPAAASSGSNPYDLVSLEGCFPLAPSFDHAGPMARDVATCENAMQALVPGFEPASSISLEELAIGIVWTERADPLVRARVEAAAALFPRGARSSCRKETTSTHC